MTDQTQTPTQDKRITVSNYDKIRNMAHNEKLIKSFAVLLGSRTAAQLYIASGLMAVSANPALMECQPASIWSTVLRAATLQLSCDPSLGQAYPVPYNDRKKGKIATLQLGYRGIEQMALRTGKYRYINSRELFEGEVLEENPLTGAMEFHGQRISDKVLGYFNHFELFEGYSHTLYMTIEELNEHARRYSKGLDRPDSPWKTEFGKMCRKTVLRLNLLRHGILNSQDKAVLEAMKEEVEGLDGEVVDTTFEEIQDEKSDEKPQHTAAENLAALGIDPEPQRAMKMVDPDPETSQPVDPEPQTVPVPPQVIAAMAREITTSTGEKKTMEHCTPEELEKVILFYGGKRELNEKQLAILTDAQVMKQYRVEQEKLYAEAAQSAA